MPDSTAGTLFLVATPIGNLEDITIRALRVLRECCLIAAEDTRHTAGLLRHFDIRTPITSLHEHNESARVAQLVARLLGGASISVVSDAGTPAVSDPGFRLVQAAIAAGIRVESVPGPSAILAALVASGLPTDAFVFVGFPPPKHRARAAWFETLRPESRTVVFFEAPHRIRETLGDALRVFGDRQVAVGRELTKLHEEILRGRLSEVIGHLTETRGEFTVVIAGVLEPDRESVAKPDDSRLFLEFGQLTESGLGRREAIAKLATRHALPSRQVYAAIERSRPS